MNLLAELQQQISKKVVANELLSIHTTYRIGGPADYFLLTETSEEVIKAIQVSKNLGLNYFVLGGGSNILVSDEGFRGLVIKIGNRGLEINDGLVQAEAGTPTALVAIRSVEAGLTGFEWAVGLPGTIGGAVRGNAGCYGGSMGDRILRVKCLKEGELVELDKSDCQFAYRSSLIKTQPGLTVLSVQLGLDPTSDLEKIQLKLKQVLEHKRTHQPVAYPTSGCVFQNWRPESISQIDELYKWLDLNPNEQVPITDQGTVPAGWLIERIQLKNVSIGAICISNLHANFFVNEGHGKASEVIALIALVKSRVREATHGRVNLMEEIEYVGF